MPVIGCTERAFHKDKSTSPLSSCLMQRRLDVRDSLCVLVLCVLTLQLMLLAWLRGAIATGHNQRAVEWISIGIPP